ncbi:MAG: 1-acyl-sn-glycerol-3-phosphate acyltransferase [Intrasporangium sp.]|uniref:lysophospholipid acyltransferase family protein n=1 Tax=Intrasporangium sp. TaxID=1925024 RepID=UPI00264A2A6B|nr:lysophospholipid acyltransferase family protein [Intrasporangium sp.]MDN5794604.1 1-acyl-sn-glycerol-3-phosphate acyltransferase [Intrasporangium sp.]
MTALEAPAPWRARLGRWVGVAVFHTAYRGRTRDPDRVPRTGPVILVANHAAFLDGPVVFSLAPRPVSFLVKQEAFTGPFGRVLRTVGQIPIDRTVGDRTALATAVAVLAGGGAVGIFPEGNRSGGEVEQVNQGAAWIALRTGARVVPVAVLGTRVPGGSKDTWPRPFSRLTVAYGEPFSLDVDPSLSGRERLRAATEQVRAVLAEHVRRARGDNAPMDNGTPDADVPAPPNDEGTP